MPTQNLHMQNSEESSTDFCIIGTRKIHKVLQICDPLCDYFLNIVVNLIMISST